MHRRLQSAFSLIEVLAVVAIVAVLLASTAPYVSGIVTATRLRTAAEIVHGQLLEAQSMAVMFNTDVELRLYEAPDLIDQAATPALRRLQILTLRPPISIADPKPGEEPPAEEEPTTFSPIGSFITLDHSIEISAQSKYTSLVDLGYQDDPGDTQGRYIALRYRSDGTPRLLPNQPWFLTLHEKGALDHAEKPTNFITLQIDPSTARLRTFQP